MRLRLTPRDDSYYLAFAAAGRTIATAADLLCDLVSGTEGRKQLAERIRDLEHENDDLTHRVQRKVAATFVTPIDREDIGLLASRLDDVLDEMEEAAELTVLYGLGALPAQTRDLVTVLQRQAALTVEAMPKLMDLDDSLRDYWIEINRLENEADEIYRGLRARVVSGEYDVFTALKLRDVLARLEDAADAFEHVADVVQTIATKES
jgi:predicted phosphate transport protein (TIGR00153 family)